MCPINPLILSSITFGNDGDVRTLLVLSGSSKIEDIGKAGNRAKPDYICDSLGQIADMLEQLHRQQNHQ